MPSDYVSETMTYVIWRVEGLWNIAVPKRVGTAFQSCVLVPVLKETVQCFLFICHGVSLRVMKIKTAVCLLVLGMSSAVKHVTYCILNEFVNVIVFCTSSFTCQLILAVIIIPHIMCGTWQ
jgi:hypothetical protein